MRKVKFIKDFANKKKGESGSYDGPVASRMVRELKVAKFDEGKDESKKKTTTKKEE